MTLQHFAENVIANTIKSQAKKQAEELIIAYRINNPELSVEKILPGLLKTEIAQEIVNGTELPPQIGMRS